MLPDKNGKQCIVVPTMPSLSKKPGFSWAFSRKDGKIEMGDEDVRARENGP